MEGASQRNPAQAPVQPEPPAADTLLQSEWQSYGVCKSLHALCFEFDCCVLLSGRDDVRAPIPQKQDILVEPEPLFGGITVHIYTSFLPNLGFPNFFIQRIFS